MQESVTSANLSLDEVKQHFDHWRTTRIKRGKIPEILWNEVKALIGRYPTNKIAQTLGVNAYQISTGINNKLKVTFVAARPAAVTPEVNKIDQTSAVGTCSLEFHRPSGGILKITGMPLVSLPAFINQFMG